MKRKTHPRSRPGRVREDPTQELRELRSLLKHVGDIILTVDRKGAILSINRTIRGLQVRNVLGSTLYDYTPPESHPKLKKVMEQVWRTGRPATYEIRGTGVKGRGSSWYETHVLPVRKGGRIVATRHFAKDITTRKCAEDALKESRQMLADILDSLQDGLLVADLATGEICDCNTAACRILGYSRKELLCLKPADLHPPQEHALLRREIDKIRSGKKTQPRAIRVKRKDGTIFYADFSSSAPTLLQGRMCAAAVFRDVTDRRTSEQALRESEMRYRAIVENAHDAIFLADTKTGIILEANKPASELLGIPVSKIKGMHQTQIHKPEDTKRYRQAFREHASGEKTGLLEALVVHRDGHQIPVEISAQVIELGDRRVMLGTFRDISERKKVELMKEDLIRDVSHGLQTPIAMAVMAYELCEKGILDEDMERIKIAQRIASKSIKKLRRDVSNILDAYAMDIRKERAPGRTRARPVSLGAVMNEVASELKPLLDEKQVSLKIKLVPDSCKVAMARHDIKLLMNNMVENAAKFTDRGSISVTSRRTSRSLYIRVKDTGCGMAAGELERTFERFYKRHPAVQGSGLGLWICKTVVELYGGGISAASPGAGKGTTITVRLPLKRSASSLGEKSSG